MDGIENKLNKIFSDIFWQEKGPPKKITRRSAVNWDSVSHINLLVALEQEFSISIPDAQALDINSYDSALEIVKEKLLNSKNTK